MNFLVAAESYPTALNPLAAFIGVLCRELVKQGHEVTVVAPQSLTSVLKYGYKLNPLYFTDDVCVKGEKKSIKVYSPYTITWGYGRFSFITNFFKSICFSYVARRLPIMDVCYAHFWNSGYMAIDFVQKRKIPLFVATGEDTMYFHKSISKDELVRLSKYTKGVICVSTKNLNESVVNGYIVQEKCKVFPNSIDNAIFYCKDRVIARNKLNLNVNDFVVAYVGRFTHRKGVARVSNAITKIGDKEIRSIFIGKTIEGENAEPDCDGIIFKGALPHNAIPDFLNASDVFVLPSLAEGCSNSIVEAMACGLPIISSDLEFNYDILNNENSILIDPNNVEEISEAIIALKKNKILRKSMSKASLRISSDLTISHRISDIVEFIKEKLSHR